MGSNGFRITRGTNISHWLSQSADRGEVRRQRFTREDVRRIADLGFDHLRLPVDEDQLWSAAGEPETEAFDLLESCLDWCAEEKLSSVVDLHILRSHFFNDSGVPRLYTDPAEAGKFTDLWLQLSARLKRRPIDRVAYELLNEPVAQAPEDWNRVSSAAFDALRGAEPGRTIVLGSNRFNSVESFDDLRIPGDPHCLLTFHFYHPMFLTHHRASWWRTGGQYEGPVEYPGRPIPAAEWDRLDPGFRTAMETENRHFDRSSMLSLLEQPLRAAKKTGYSLYCGEFGVYRMAPAGPKKSWYRDIVSVFKEHSIAWANWDYRGGFGLFDGDRRRTDVVECLGLDG